MPYRFSALFLFCLIIPLTGCDSASVESDPPDEPPPQARVIDVTVNTAAARRPISPYIYGANQDLGHGNRWTVRRLGGNRLTGYNWENNASNAGNDWFHSSDDFLVSEVGADANEPGSVMTRFHDQALAVGASSVLTLQTAGYVARDKNGTVEDNETAPSARWVPVSATKAAPFALSPDLTDGWVYMDEFVNFMVQRYGSAATETGVRWYSLDNEPALWAHTHPRIHPDPVTAEELIQRSIEYAAAVKAVDPASEILGPALFGMSAYETLQDAPDWGAVRQGHTWFISYYLEQMRQAEQDRGQRLLDVLDVHWYPEARGDSRIVFSTALSPKDVAARLQAPRTLWDPSYVEDSWIGQWKTQFLPLIPKLQEAIAAHYPGTRLAISEYNYGAGNSISGGLAQADVLGIFGTHDVYLAALWQLEEQNAYIAAAFDLYRNYDGRQGQFGNTSVAATTSDIENTSVYAAIHDGEAEQLHVIALNKSPDEPLAFNFTLQGASYTTAEVWTLDRLSPRIQRLSESIPITNNTFSRELPPLTAAHVVLR